jgi:glycosyltransferase involved in cell wall biosynthesis
MKKMSIVAYNINTGGGKTLLFGLLNNLPGNLDFTLYADSRLENEITNLNLNLCIKYIQNSLFSRLRAEYDIWATARHGDITLMFGGLPPIIKNKSYIYLFLQNLNNIKNTPLNGYPWNIYLRIIFERIWLRLFVDNCNTIIVQTLHVKSALINKSFTSKRVLVMPFAEVCNAGPFDMPAQILNNVNSESFSFIYPASYEPHKNHKVLLNAWDLLLTENITPKLFLTLHDSDFNRLLNVIPSCKKANIFNLGVLRHDLLLSIYQKYSCLIFPSKYESFGLPLLEATHFKLPIIAPELDYVRELCSPVETFNPTSPISLARSVKRFMEISHPPFFVKKPEDFLNFLVSNQNQ